MTADKDRIQNAINHIKTAVDVDPWAMEIAVEAMEAMIKDVPDTNVGDIMVRLKEAELYQEIKLFHGNEEIGIAEVDIKNIMISRLDIYPPYRGKGYGQEVVRMLCDKYETDCLWVNADNDIAIHVYEKCGFTKVKPTMYLMERGEQNETD